MADFKINLHMEFNMEVSDGWSKEDAIASFFEEFSYPESVYLTAAEYDIERDDKVEVEMDLCPVCGRRVPKESMTHTTDCHGIVYRYVCPDCYDKVMEKGYDGEYYTELDECIDDDY